MSRLFIDVGHQDTIGDNGAANKVVEYDRNIAIVNALKKYVDFVQVPDHTGSLANAIKWINANSTEDDVLFSIHTNAGGGDGVEIYYFAGSEPSRKKAQRGCDIISTEAYDPNRGAKDESTCRFGKFGIVHDTKPWAFLIECDFVDDPTGDVVSNHEAYARGIAKWAGEFGFATRNLVEPVPAPIPTPTPTPTPTPEPTPTPVPTPEPDPSENIIKDLTKKVEDLTKEVSDTLLAKENAETALERVSVEKTDVIKAYDTLVENTAKSVTEFQSKIKVLEDWKINHKCDIMQLNFWDACKIVTATLLNKAKRDQILKEVKEKFMGTATKPGYKTTEFWLNLIVQVTGGATVLGIIPNEGTIAKIAALVLMVLANYGYQYNRKEEKVAAISSTTQTTQ